MHSMSDTGENNVLAVGSCYEDILLYMESYPSEDYKQFAKRAEYRRGGTVSNMLTVLSQFPSMKTYFCGAMARRETSRLVTLRQEYVAGLLACLEFQVPAGRLC